MKDIIKIGKELIDKNEDFVIAKVIQTVGSAPRKKGAWMLMTRDGTTYGTVGGGVLEAEVERICRETFLSKKPGIHAFNLTEEQQRGIDMRCGGEARVSIEYIDHLLPTGFEDDAQEEATAFIFGAGHVGKEIAAVTKYVGFATVVLDDRPEFANRERFPDADRIVVLKDFLTAFKEIETGPDSYVIIVTRGHTADYDVLKQALERESCYIGMIGSRKKIAAIYELLRRDGFSNSELEKVHAPIGLPIGAETPKEIAISVAAELIQVKAELAAPAEENKSHLI